MGHLPTLTAVLLSSSLALLPPPSLPLMLRRLELRFGRIMALMGRGTPCAGDVGGDAAMGAATAAPWEACAVELLCGQRGGQAAFARAERECARCGGREGASRCRAKSR